VKLDGFKVGVRSPAPCFPVVNCGPALRPGVVAGEAEDATRRAALRSKRQSILSRSRMFRYKRPVIKRSENSRHSKGKLRSAATR
jgi:hypothetical protein